MNQNPLFVGIDVSRLKHDVANLNENKQKILISAKKRKSYRKTQIIYGRPVYNWHKIKTFLFLFLQIVRYRKTKARCNMRDHEETAGRYFCHAKKPKTFR